MIAYVQTATQTSTLSPSGPCAWAPLDPWRYADEGESGSGADGGESVLSNGGRDGGESGMFTRL